MKDLAIIFKSNVNTEVKIGIVNILIGFGYQLQESHNDLDDCKNIYLNRTSPDAVLRMDCFWYADIVDQESTPDCDVFHLDGRTNLNSLTAMIRAMNPKDVQSQLHDSLKDQVDELGIEFKWLKTNYKDGDGYATFTIQQEDGDNKVSMEMLKKIERLLSLWGSSSQVVKIDEGCIELNIEV